MCTHIYPLSADPPFLLLLVFLLLALLISILELVVFVRRNPGEDEKKSLFSAHLKYAFCGCCSGGGGRGAKNRQETVVAMDQLQENL